MAKGMSIVKSLMCAAKLRQGIPCTMSETAAALDTLAWAYKNRKKLDSAQKKHQKKTQKGIKKDVKKTYRMTKRVF
jgi:hypothetical protein